MEKKHHFLRGSAGIFNFRKVDPKKMIDKDGEPISSLVEQVKDTSYEYLIRVILDQKKIAKKKGSKRTGTSVYTSGKVAIDLGKDPSKIEYFLENWPKTNAFLGIDITRGAVCRFGFKYMRLWVLPLRTDHYALCLAYRVELADDTSIKIPEELRQKIKKKRPHADDVASEAFREFMRRNGIKYHAVFSFPGWEDKIWKWKG